MGKPPVRVGHANRLCHTRCGQQSPPAGSPALAGSGIARRARPLCPQRTRGQVGIVATARRAFYFATSKVKTPTGSQQTSRIRVHRPSAFRLICSGAARPPKRSCCVCRAKARMLPLNAIHAIPKIPFARSLYKSHRLGLVASAFKREFIDAIRLHE